MNAKLFTFLFVLVAFCFSCKEQEDIGAEFLSEEDLLYVVFSDTSHIKAYSVLDDSIATDEKPYALAGAYQDPVFGDVTASFYTQIRLNAFLENGLTNIDSAILTMVYANQYGDENASMLIGVYEMTDTIDINNTYYSYDQKPYDVVAIGEKSFIPNYEDSVIAGEDTLPPSLRIPLSQTFISKIENADASHFNDHDLFGELINGFFITATPESATGQIIYFDLMHTLSRITVYYKNDQNEQETFFFNLNSDCARFNHFEHNGYQDATGNLKAQVLEGDSSLGDQTLYLQPTGGIQTIVRFPLITKWVENQNIAINKAELFIPVDESTIDEELFPVTPKVVVWGINDEGNEFILPDYNESTYDFGGSYLSSEKAYKFNITRYIQNILNGTLNNNGLYLRPSVRSYQADRVVIKGSGQPEGLRLRILYTILQ